ncbi:MAG: anaerobic glycerol-3-phosphate dehydrogenase subunit C [Bacillota bacterium]|nr:anaerobic glycerol-3-phosphate dehydrogenase subunit C [Bacillota bacterium]
MDWERDRVKNLDACIKCSACTAQCPVAAVYPLFPGPKSAGPDVERFRLEGLAMDMGSLNYCSNCKTCEVTCPSGVRITEMILRAREKSQQTGQKDGKTTQRRIRDLILGRAEYLGKLGTVWPGMTNAVLGVQLVRGLMERTLGISQLAPLPAYKPKFRGSTGKRLGQKTVVYFPGCFATYNDSLTGRAVVKVLEHNGYDVSVPPFHCCGVPLQANGHFHEGRENVRKNLVLMEPYLQAKVPVITACTSCSLALKEEYPKEEASILGTERIGHQAYDLFEFLWELHERGELREEFKQVTVSLGYHAPCHLKAQGIGTPSLRLLRLIPGVNVNDLDAGCCGLSGSFGFKQERYKLAMQIGNPLFSCVKGCVTQGKFETMLTECGGCQVQIQHGSGVEAKHPIWILMQAYGLKLN